MYKKNISSYKALGVILIVSGEHTGRKFEILDSGLLNTVLMTVKKNIYAYL